MTTPQDPPVRLKQKRRRTKQLAQWQAAQPEKAAGAVVRHGRGRGKPPAKKA